MTCITIATNPPLQKRRGGGRRVISMISEALAYLNKYFQ
jgi:hypothetical protein